MEKITDYLNSLSNNTIDDTSSIRSRFKGVEWYKNNFKNITVGGAGGIGSWFIFMAARAFPIVNFHVYDDDLINRHNIGGQLYSLDDIGKMKVKTIKNMTSKYSNKNINIYMSKYTTDTYDSNSTIKVACFDNMKGRKDMFENWKAGLSMGTKKEQLLFVDGRLLAEQYEVFFVTPKNYKEYESKHLFSDSEVEKVSCTSKQTSHFAALIAATMVEGITNHITNIVKNTNIRELPFHVTHYGELFITNLEYK